MDCVAGFPETLSKTNAEGVKFLLTDLDMALTFMDVAAVSRNGETVERNYKNARVAYDAVLRLLPKFTPNAEQLEMINGKLSVLKARLEAVGKL